MNYIYKTIFLILLFFASINLNAQNKITIEGVVLDSTETPMPYATIMLLEDISSNMKSFCITNDIGAFKIEAPDTGNYKLQITFIGYGDFYRKIKVKSTDKN